MAVQSVLCISLTICGVVGQGGDKMWNWVMVS